MCPRRRPLSQTEGAATRGSTYFFRMPRNVRSLEPSLCGSSGASTVGGVVDVAMANAMRRGACSRYLYAMRVCDAQVSRAAAGSRKRRRVADRGKTVVDARLFRRHGISRLLRGWWRRPATSTVLEGTRPSRMHRTQCSAVQCSAVQLCRLAEVGLLDDGADEGKAKGVRCCGRGREEAKQCKVGPPCSLLELASPRLASTKGAGSAAGLCDVCGVPGPVRVPIPGDG